MGRMYCQVRKDQYRTIGAGLTTSTIKMTLLNGSIRWVAELVARRIRIMVSLEKCWILSGLLSLRKRRWQSGRWLKKLKVVLVLTRGLGTWWVAFESRG